MPPVIQVHSLSKRYRIGLKEKRKDTLLGQIGSALRAPLDNFRQLRSLSRFKEDDESTFWALRDINFEVQQGEVLGIIGHNGAGKSTLLKILSRITEPNEGRITVRGRIGALLEVGTGFHPELTGRDNIYMNGTILGMTRREIDRKLDEIVDFSGVEKYIDTPVKFYSSGMKVRLGFAVAAHLEPEILVIDEVLAVGDAEFQKKCLGKMKNISNNEGRTVLFVSHNMGAVKNLCNRTVVLKGGYIEFNGNTLDAIDHYFGFLQKSENGKDLTKIGRSYGGTIVRFTNVKTFDLNNILKNEFYYKEPVKIKTTIEVQEDLKNYCIFIKIGTLDGERIVFSELLSDRLKNENLPKTLAKGFYEISTIIHTPLLPGSYSIYLGFGLTTGETLDWLENVYDFHVLRVGLNKNEDYKWNYQWGYVLNENEWTIDKINI